jgi:uncharacterized membrane protein
MPAPKLADHPLHPVLVAAPAALLPLGLVLDALYRATDDDRYANAAYYSLAGGLIGGIAAGVAGAIDYLTIEPDTDVKRTANTHALINGGVLAATAANLALRRNGDHHAGGSVALSALAAIGVLASGWFGARMVHEQKAHDAASGEASRVGKAPELHSPQDGAVLRALERAERAVPSAGPAWH